MNLIYQVNTRWWTKKDHYMFYSHDFNTGSTIDDLKRTHGHLNFIMEQEWY